MNNSINTTYKQINMFFTLMKNVSSTEFVYKQKQ